MPKIVPIKLTISSKIIYISLCRNGTGVVVGSSVPSAGPSGLCGTSAAAGRTSAVASSFVAASSSAGTS